MPEQQYFHKRKAMKLILKKFEQLENNEIDYLTFEQLILYCQINTNVSVVFIKRIIMRIIGAKPKHYYIYNDSIFLAKNPK
jgi:hypothetical protein